jgi:hypothetical protein
MAKNEGMNRRRLFRIVAPLVALLAFGGLLLAADIYMHRRLEPYAAVNIWGYRGPTIGKKRRNERRILVVGPSTAFGVGFPPQQAIPAQLENLLRARLQQPVSIVNLGFPGEDAFAYRADVEDYRYLKADAVIFYGDNNQTGGATPIVLRRLSPVFRLTGYYPILDTAIREKAIAIRSGGQIGAAYRGDKVVFRPALADRISASALTAAADIADSLHRTLGPLTVKPEAQPSVTATCQEYGRFCDAIHSAVAYARSLGLRVLVVNSPNVSDGQVRTHAAIHEMLRQRFGSDASVRYLDLGWTVDLRDTSLAYDGLHLTPPGNALIAAKLVEPVLDLLKP